MKWSKVRPPEKVRARFPGVVTVAIDAAVVGEHRIIFAKIVNGSSTTCCPWRSRALEQTQRSREINVEFSFWRERAMATASEQRRRHCFLAVRRLPIAEGLIRDESR
jgi:hypothetical protein